MVLALSRGDAAPRIAVCDMLEMHTSLCRLRKRKHGRDCDHQIQQLHSIYPFSLRNEAGLHTPAIKSSANRWAIGEVKQVALPQQRERDTRLLPERVDEYLIGKKLTGNLDVNVIHYGYGGNRVLCRFSDAGRRSARLASPSSAPANLHITGRTRVIKQIAERNSKRSPFVTKVRPLAPGTNGRISIRPTALSQLSTQSCTVLAFEIVLTASLTGTRERKPSKP
jgi:hypothetical protein